jgi:hypothetical protein
MGPDCVAKSTRGLFGNQKRSVVAMPAS